MTKLQAINRVLRLSGRKPVSKMESGGAVVQEAEREIDDADQRIQEEGWNENTEVDIKLERDSVTNKIEVGDDVLSIDGYGFDAFRRVAKRGGFLFDLDDNTFSWSNVSSVRVEIIRKIPFSELSESLANYIVADAAVSYYSARPHEDRNTRGRIERNLARQLAEAKYRSHRSQNRRHDTNVLETEEAADVRGRRHRFLNFR